MVKKKLYIKFDENKRIDYLTGFHKRKVQRREKAKQESEQLLKEEIKRVKDSYREDLLQKMRSAKLPNFLADDLHVVTSVTTKDTGDHTVSVEEIDLAKSHYFMGENCEEPSEIPGLSRNSSLTPKPKCSLKKALKMNPKKSKFRKKMVKRRKLKGRAYERK